MKLNQTQILNAVYGIVCAVASLSAETDTMPFLPHKWRHYVSVAAMAALYVKSHWNLWINPNGTPAATAYVAPETPDPPTPGVNAQ